MFASLRRLAPFVRPYGGRLGLGIAAFGGSRLLEALVPLLLAVGIDRIAAGHHDLTLPVAGIFAAVVARYAVVTFARYAVRSVGQHVAFDLRQSLYAALQTQGSAFFARHTIGDMMTRAISDIGLIQRFIAMGTILMVVLVYATVVGFGFMLYLSPSLTALLLPPLPFIYFYAQWSAGQMAEASRDVQDRLSDLGAHVQENLSGIRTIQAMVQEENEIRRFAATNQAYADAFYRQAAVNSLMTAWMPSLAALCAVTILGYGGWLVLEGRLSVGSFVAFFMYLNMVVAPFRVAGFIVNLFQRAAVASDRLFEIVTLKPEIPDQPSGRAPDRIHGAIELRHLSWQYPGRSTPALVDVSMSIAAGESISIMGRVGSGKSTLL
ncbi:MAG: ABC transporter ATP-binding protein, partial [Gammaproteobacteria bacterium]